MTLILTVFALTATGLSQSPAKILKRAESAMGGKKALLAINSVTKTGKIRRISDGAGGSYIFQTSQPNLFRFSYDLNGLESEVGYNGRSGWVRHSSTGLKTLTGASATDLQAIVQFRNYFWLTAVKDKSRTVSDGKSVIDGKAVDVIILTTQKGSAFKMYFDSATGLLIRDEVRNDGITEQTDYADYRTVGRTKHAFVKKITIDGEVFEITFEDVKLNQSISSTTFDFPKVSGAPLPDIAFLLKELQTNEDKVEAILDTYSFVQKSTRREVGKDGVLRETGSETYQMSFHKGNRIARLIEKDGKPLSASEQADSDKDAAKTVDEIDRRITKRSAESESGPPSREGRRISIAELLRASTLLNPRREKFRGRDVIVFDFEPNPSFDYKNAKSMLRFFGKTAGSMWIDEKDKQVVRLEAFLADSFNIGGGLLAKLKKGASFTLEQERVNDEIWLPSTADINLSVRVLLVKGIDLNQVIRSYDYRKFTTEVKDAKVDPIKEQ